MLLDRRGFLGYCALIGASRFGAPGSARVTLLIHHLPGAGESTPHVRRGVTLGVEEAQHAATLFGADIAIRGPITGDEIIPHDALPIWIMQEVAPRTGAGHVVFNVHDSSDAARACARNVFHVAPRRGESATWLPDLTRFGADTLNKRFFARFGTPMTGPAWCGWFAVKCAWEGALKSRATTAENLSRWLERPTSRFDGHKGTPLYFDAAHQLVQPLYGPDGTEIAPTPTPTPTPSPAPCDWKS